MYKIFYDYTDLGGYEWRNCQDSYDGDFAGLQEIIKNMRLNGCYNIDVTEVEDCDEPFDAPYDENIEYDDTVLSDLRLYEIQRSLDGQTTTDVLALTDDELQEYIELYQEQGYKVSYEEVTL